MRPRTAVLAAILALLLVFSFPFASAQPDPDRMRVDSELSITSLSTLEGSGRVTITLYGQTASDLRGKIIDLYDDPIHANQILEASEVRGFLIAFTHDIVSKTYWGITIKSTTNYTQVSESYIHDHTSGLVASTISTTDPLQFSTDIQGSGSGSSKIVQMAQGAYDTFALALEYSAGYVFNGTLELSARVSTYGIGSLTKPNLEAGKISALRLPWGTVLWYKFTGHDGPSEEVGESLTYESISLLDSQMISFVFLFFGCFFILRTPGNRFDKFEKLHPRKFRKYAKPLMSVRLSAYILTGVLVVLYLVPYIFSFASPTALIYGAYLYVLVPLAVVAELVLSRIIYDKAGMDIPEESVIEVKQAIVQPAEGEGEILCKICYRPIDAGLDMFQCVCGLTMHSDCAEKAQTCPQCGEPLVQLRTRSIQCKSCGETFLYSGEEDAYSIQCTKCSAFQEEIKAGENYLIVDKDPRNAFMMIRAMGLSNRPAMCMTTSFPGKIRSDYDLKDVMIKWFSDSSTDIDNVNPKELEGDAMESASTFLMTTKEAGVLIDGIESLIEQNGFDKALAFVKRLNDLATIHGSTVLLSLDKTKLPPEQFKAISDEFDEIHDYQ
jgi:hypothetical protein